MVKKLVSASRPSLRSGVKGSGEGKGARGRKKRRGGGGEGEEGEGLKRGKGRKRLPQGPHILPVNYNSRSSGECKFPFRGVIFVIREATRELHVGLF